MTASSPTTPVAGALACALLAVAGCSSGESYTDTYDSKLGVSSSPRLAVSGPIPKGGGDYKVGNPYQIAGRWYYPRHEPGYSEVGVGSWYGPGFHGRKTANGEIFDMNALTAAHKTLPLPTYAYVTNLDNGRTILVRVNDRGPYVDDRLIDLSKAAADALGYHGRGLSRVRVRYAGDAPLDGNDQRERTFLASQPWAGDTRYASNDAGADFGPGGWQTTSRPPLRSMDSMGPARPPMQAAYQPQPRYAPPPSYSTKQMTPLPPIYAAETGYGAQPSYTPQTYVSQQMPPAYPQYPAQPAYPSQQHYPPQPAPQMPPQASAYAAEPLSPQAPAQSASGQTWSPFAHRAGYSQRSGLGAAPPN